MAAYEPFQAFIEWVKKSREILAKQVLTGKTVNGTLMSGDEAWHAKGGYNALTDVIEGVEKFGRTAIKTRKDLEKFDKDIQDLPEAMKRAD